MKKHTLTVSVKSNSKSDKHNFIDLPYSIYSVLKILLSVTSKRAIIESGQSPVHSAADGGHVQCLQLLIDRGFDVNNLLDRTISDYYNDKRRSALYFAVSNGDVTCIEMLLNAGAKPDLDPLHCLLVAVRAGRYEIVKMLLAKKADVNCYFTVVSDTIFPTSLQYCLKDEEMMRLLLNNGYNVDKCFHCHHDYPFNMGFPWKDIYAHRPCCVICDGEDKIPVSLSYNNNILEKSSVPKPTQITL